MLWDLALCSLLFCYGWSHTWNINVFVVFGIIILKLVLRHLDTRCLCVRSTMNIEHWTRRRLQSITSRSVDWNFKLKTLFLCHLLPQKKLEKVVELLDEKAKVKSLQTFSNCNFQETTNFATVICSLCLLVLCVQYSAFLEIVKCIRLIRYSRVSGVGCWVSNRLGKVFKQKRFNDQSNKKFSSFLPEKSFFCYILSGMSWCHGKLYRDVQLWLLPDLFKCRKKKKMFKKKSRPTIFVRFRMKKSTLVIWGLPQACNTNIKKIDLEMLKMERKVNELKKNPTTKRLWSG